MNSSTVILRSTKTREVHLIIEEIMNLLDFQSIIPQNAKVVIKVNLSTPFKENAAASNTSPEILEAVLQILKSRTANIIVGESNGMRYKAEEAFEVSGFYEILGRHNVAHMNFSNDEWIETNEKLIKGWGLPKTLLEADVFMTLPVLKTHATTVFTGSLKNQFGCYPQYNRLLLHPHLDEVLVLINKILKPRISIMDGIIGMEGRGPINGKPKRLDMILASTDPVAVDATAMRLVGIDPYTSGHVRLAAERGLGNIDETAIAIDGDFEKLKTVIEPAERDLPIRLLGVISHSKFLTEKLIMNPNAFMPMRNVAMKWRNIRDNMFRRGRSG
jgi:uncharacterized protein (DUF362 family)